MYNFICVDDDHHMQVLYRKIFTDRGNKVRLFSRSDKILKSFTDEPADLLILDIDLPGQSGLDLCTEFRKNPKTYNLPIILVSAHDSEECILKGLNSGADDYIVKPFKPAELIAKSHSVVKKRKKPNSKDTGVEIGCQFASRYEIIKRIGTGGFSSVFHAIDNHGIPAPNVALKVLEASRLKQDEPDYMAIFLREAYSLSKLNNPSIVKLLDFGQANGFFYLAMEYLQGKTLQQILDESGAIPEDEVALIGYVISTALQYLEHHKVVHRDIKPVNIIVLKNGDIKLIDFGLARRFQDDTITVEGIFKGTPQFAAPEIIRMESNIDCRSDIFSLGATLFYLASNQKPFPGDNPMEVFQNRFISNSKSLREVDPSMSFQFSDLIGKMLSSSKEDRPCLGEIISITKGILSQPK